MEKWKNENLNVNITKEELWNKIFKYVEYVNSFIEEK